MFHIRCLVFVLDPIWTKKKLKLLFSLAILFFEHMILQKDRKLNNTLRKPMGYMIYSIGERVVDDDADKPDDES